MEPETVAFLQKDYELKIRYLSDHYTRMWSRCNFFVGLESALTVALFGWFKDRGGFSQDAGFIAVIGAVSCLCWYGFGAQDRYLAEVYRKQVGLLGEILERHFNLSKELADESLKYTFVGDTQSKQAQVGMKFYQWRIGAISTTKLAVWFPVLVFIYWILMFGLIKGISLRRFFF
jgi:hypothetical protein